MKGNQNSVDANAWIYNSVALSGNIRSITISGISGTYDASKAYAQVGTSAITSRSTGSATVGTNGTNSVTWTFTGNCGGYFTIFAAKGFTTNAVYATSFIITYEA